MNRLLDAAGWLSMLVFLAWGVGGVVCWHSKCRTPGISHRLAVGFTWLFLVGGSVAIVWAAVIFMLSLVRP
jgi:Kef-type K+ transport system membrane component KefB